MAITNQQKNNILGIVVGLFNAAPGQQFGTEFVNAVDAGLTEAQLADIMADHPVFTDNIMGGQNTTPAQVAVLMNHYGLVADGIAGSAASQANAFFTNSINTGTDFGEISFQATTFLLSDSIPTEFIETAHLLKNKIIASENYSVNNSSTDLATLQAPLAQQSIYFGTDGDDVYSGSSQGEVISGGLGGDDITLEGAKAARDVVVLKKVGDSQIRDTNNDGRIIILEDLGLDKVSNFKTGDGNTDDRLDVSSFGFTGVQRGMVDASAKVPTFETDLTSIPDLFNDPSVGGDRGLAYSEIPLPPEFGVSQSFVFIDANMDGDFTAASDMIIELLEAGPIPESILIL